MDDVYGDLENYNDVNIVEELRNENKELKFKNEEYATNLERLQKDFDRISLEYKKLEMNYSTLLKTARAEIERKTQIIMNLNKEKDAIVLSSIQNSNKSLYLLRKQMARDKPNNRKSDGQQWPNKNTKEMQEPKSFGPERERTEESRLPSTETLSTGNTDDSSKVSNIDNKLGKMELYDNSSECKENIKIKLAQGIRNRRKSMPAAVVSKQLAKFSSDDEYEGNYSAEDVKRDWPAKDDKSRRNFDRYKQSQKISETSGIDEKYSSYHESSRETYYKGKPHRYSDKYKSARDRYEAQRMKRQFSPERGRRPREYSNEEYQKPNFPARHRVLESPPFEKYDPRRYRERRPNYGREQDERLQYHQDRVVKHKATSDYEGPSTKRARVETLNKPTGAVSEDNRWRKDLPPTQQKAFPDFQKQLLNSCQSPDYHPDEIAQPTKEIRLTALTELEDPRHTSKKYAKTIEANQVKISTALGRNVPMKVIDKKTWDTPSKKLPDALQKPPRHIRPLTESLYTELENPVSNMSLESGEINSETNDGLMTEYVTRSFYQDYENEREYQKSLKDQKIAFPFSRHDEVYRPKFSANTQVEFGRDDVEKTRTYHDIVEPNTKSSWNITQPYIKACDNVDNKPIPHQEKQIDSKLCQKNMETHSKLLQGNDNTCLKSNFETENQSNPRDKAKIEPKLNSRDNVQALPKSYHDNAKTANEPSTAHTEQPTKSAQYEIPKKKLEEKKQESVSNPLGILLSQLQLSGKPVETKPPEAKLDVDKTFGPDEENLSSKIKEKAEEPKNTRQLRDRTKMTPREIVAGDLELSDETSDNIVTQKRSKKTKQKRRSVSENKSEDTKKVEVTKESIQKTTESQAKPEKSNDDKEISDKNKKMAKPPVDLTTTEVPDVSKTKKSKKKSQKQKVSKETVKDTQVDVKEKKARSKTAKENKLDEKKSKFSDLFGDSSSLITPEDLGLATSTDSAKKYVPIFEDAQDAADVNVSNKPIQQIQSQIPSQTVTSDLSGIQAKAISLPISLPNVLNISKQVTKLKEEVHVTVHEVTPNMEVVAVEEATKELDVVKTVIISTGVQPPVEDIQRETQENNNVVVKPSVQAKVVAKVQETAILALATSTPHKDHIRHENDVESSCNNSTDTGVDQSSTSTGVEQQNDDVPDVRIFVRRRRKFKK